MILEFSSERIKEILEFSVTHAPLKYYCPRNLETQTGGGGGRREKEEGREDTSPEEAMIPGRAREAMQQVTAASWPFNRLGFIRSDNLFPKPFLFFSQQTPTSHRFSATLKFRTR